MKEKLRLEDFYEEDFTTREWIMYGIVAPVVMIAGCLIAEVINNL